MTDSISGVYSCQNKLSQEVLPLTTFNKYFTIIQLIGQGDYGNVYKCVDNINDRLCAMKIVASQDTQVIDTVAEESDIGCEVWELFNEYIDTLHPIYYRGYIDPKIMDIDK